MIARFITKIKVDKRTDCWNWTASTNRKGYGHFGVRDADGKWRIKAAHRVSYEYCIGKIPSGIKVCHRCDNPKCVNPDHLWLGTDKDNSVDKFRKNRQAIVAGSKNPNAILNEEAVKKLRQLYKAGYTKSNLASIFNIKLVTVRKIVTYKLWKHVV